MKHLCVAICGVVLAGCASRIATMPYCEDKTVCGGAYQHYRCRHAHIESILGLNDFVLSDTNRFNLAALPYSQRFTLTQPLFGFYEASVYLDEMEPPSLSRRRDRPHQLRGVELKRVLSETSSADDLITEGAKVCDAIAKLIDIETPRIELADITAWRKTNGRHMIGGVRTCICFDLAHDQDIEVRLIEGVYAVRDGVPLLVSPPIIEIDITFNKKLCFVGRKIRHLEDDDTDIKIERELQIGSDASKQLEKAMHEGIERMRDGAAKRRKKNLSFQSTNIVSTAITPTANSAPQNAK